MKYYVIMQHKFYCVLFLLLGLSPVFGQSGANSPYSRFGIGDVTDNNFMFSRQMGGMGASYIDPYYINIVNPASYAFLKATAFDVGLYARRSTLSESDASVTQWSGNLEYLSLAFPLTNPINEVIEGAKKDYYFGMAFTLMPHSDVSYNVFAEESDPIIGDYTLNYVGSGGSYKFLWGNAVNYKDFAFGLNIGYLFGNIQYEQNTIFTENAAAYFNNFVTDYRLSGFIWNAGFLYNTVLNRKELENNNGAPIKRLSIGIHANSNSSFNTNTNVNLISVLNTGSSTISDTTSSQNVEGRGTLPAEIGLGAIYHHGGRHGIGFNYTNTFWSNYTNDAETVGNGNAQELANTFRVNMGGYYRPSNKTYSSYFKKVYYRYGLYYNTDPRNEGGENINSYGVTLGLGMPFIYQRKISHANIGIDLGRRGTGTAVEESFIQFNVSFTYNDDEWFLKRRYN